MSNSLHQNCPLETPLAVLAVSGEAQGLLRSMLAALWALVQAVACGRASLGAQTHGGCPPPASVPARLPAVRAPSVSIVFPGCSAEGPVLRVRSGAER